MAFTIDEQKCKRDGWCVDECPARIIQQRSADQVPAPAGDFDQYCLKCGHCVAVCPHGAFSLPWLKPEDCIPVRKELALSPPQAAQFLRSRRSTRTFKDTPVSRPCLSSFLRLPAALLQQRTSSRGTGLSLKALPRCGAWPGSLLIGCRQSSCEIARTRFDADSRVS